MNAINSPATIAMGNNPLFSAEEVAARYGYGKQTLANMRSAGRGPRYVKLPGGRVRYRLSDLIDWERQGDEPIAA